MAVTGGKNIAKALAGLDEKIRNNVSDEAVREAAKFVLEQAQEDTYMTPGLYDTGRYYRSLDYKAGRTVIKDKNLSGDAVSRYIVTYYDGLSRVDITGAYYGAILESKYNVLFNALQKTTDVVGDFIIDRIRVAVNRYPTVR